MKQLTIQDAIAQAQAAPAWAKVYPYQSHHRTYYRYMAGVGDRVTTQRHIPGGAVGNPIVEGRAAQVKAAITAGATPAEILKMLTTWRR